MADDGVTEEEVDQLGRWGEALLGDARPEVRAAGRAIVMLAAEVDRLQRLLWHRELGVECGETEAPADRAAAPGQPAPDHRVETDLRGSVRRAVASATRLGRR